RLLGGDFSVGAGGGVFGFGSLIVNDTSIISNVVTFNPFLGSSTSVSGDAGGLMLSCCIGNDSMTISNTQILSNAVIVRGAAGFSQFGIGGGMLAYAPVSVTNSIIRGNLVSAMGDANNLQGGGIQADGHLLMQNSTVTENRLQAANAVSVIFAGGGVRVSNGARILNS